EHQQVGLEKDRRIFQRLVFAFGYAQHHDLGRFAQIITGWTNQVAHVFDEQKIEVFKLPIRQMTLDHASIQMASAASRDLLYRKMKALEPVGVVFRLDVTRQNSHAIMPWQGFEGAFQQTGFAGTGRTDEVQAQNAMLQKSATQLRRDAVVFTEYFSLQRHSFHIVPPPDKRTPVHLH